jgi:hypothetical protein
MRWITLALALSSLGVTTSVAFADELDLPRGLTWDFELGTVMRRLHTEMDAAQLGQSAFPDAARRVAAPLPATIDGVGLRMSQTYGTASGCFLGIDGELLGDVTGPTIDAVTPAGPHIHASPSQTLLVHAVAGVRGFTGRALFSAEIAAGGGGTNYGIDCVDPTCGMRFRDATEGFGDLEGRAIAGLFVSNVFVVRAAFGASLIDPGAYSVAVTVGGLVDRRHLNHHRNPPL